MSRKTMARFWLGFGVGLVAWLAFSLLFLQAERGQNVYPAVMNEDSKVYDGDTLQDVYIEVKKFPQHSTDNGVLWPGLLLKDDTLYVVTDIRLNGIDTPEKRPRKKGRTPESLKREKAAAAKAQQALLKLIKDGGYAFEVVNPKLGKYAGRIVADVKVTHQHTGGTVYASSYMIKQKHAIPYSGGKKRAFDDWYEAR